MGCESTPKLLDFCIEQQGVNDTVPDGYIAYIVMSKVPGKDLAKYDEMRKEEQHRVQIAFLKALWYVVLIFKALECSAFRCSNFLLMMGRSFQECSFHYWDQRLPNVVWDPDQDKW
jgi:hypothetical protein